MSRYTVSSHLRVIALFAIGSTVATVFIAPHARAQSPGPEGHRDATIVADDVPAEPAPPDARTTEPAAPEDQRKALALVEEGNRLAEDLLLIDAIDKYREALTYRDHPLIHYNLARLLNALDRTLEAHESVERALRSGPAALSDEPAQAQQLHALLLGLRTQLRGRLVEIRLSSAQPGVEASIDDRTVPTAPARPEMFLPGTHRLAAQAPGHRPLLHTMELGPGASVHLHLTSRRAFTPWKPWALTGAAGAVALTGFGLYWHGRAERDELADRIAAQCRPSCTKDRLAAFDDDWRRVRAFQRVGVGTLVTGSGAVLLGAGLVLWNQRRELRLVGTDRRPMSIVPVVSPEMTGLVGAMTF